MRSWQDIAGTGAAWITERELSVLLRTRNLLSAFVEDLADDNSPVDDGVRKMAREVLSVADKAREG